MHLIDALGSGGAERMAVNLVNTLPRDRYRPVLCTSRFDGALASDVSADVARIQLHRRNRFDLSAIMRLAKLLNRLNVKIVHAHSTSLFLAAAVTRIAGRSVIIWHDHYGLQQVASRNRWVYGLAARRAEAVISVTESLAAWTNDQLRVPKARIRYIPNFVCAAEEIQNAGVLPGRPGARIVCVAGMRPEKDLVNLVRAMKIVSKHVPGSHLLLIGPAKDSVYSEKVQDEIRNCGLEADISWLGERHDVGAVLRGCDIGVLSSASEGLPIALLEYGLAGLSAVCTNVGQCAEVMDDGRAGILVPAADSAALSEALISLLMSSERRRQLGELLASRVQERYSAKAALNAVEDVYAQVLRRLD
jgi:glycosyltransferase involved in cell wall biosynthesis